ncbi:hypothetical protein FQR65_LT10994 [Abscondita terminalis]|nr:hypothetical protein FQR65_LT10994 [Abscondita terminalis]
MYSSCVIPSDPETGDRLVFQQCLDQESKHPSMHFGATGGTVLGAVAGVGALLLVFLLYINKKWLWGAVGGMNCCEDACPPVSTRPVPSPDLQAAGPGPLHRHKLVKAYSFDIGGESSSESELGGNKLLPSTSSAVGSYFPPRSPPDLISLVEKGRVGLSSNSSCCSSTTSSCIVLMNTEADGTEVLSCIESETQTHLVNKCGHLEIALLYDAPMRKMTVHVLQARDIPSRDRGQPTHTQVRLILLPSKKQKHKTKIRSGDNPQYVESFLLHRVNPEDVNSMGIRLRLYGCERMRRERLIGEAVVSFANINLELENNFWLNLEPRANTTLSGYTGDLMSLARSDSTGSTHSMQHGGVPELLLGLSYNATTGRLSVEIVKGSHFRNLALNRAPDTYVKLHLVSSTGQQLGYSKTTVRRGQPNPLFKETFIFQVALFQLADVTLMASVYNRRGVTKKKEMVGWFSLGLNSSGAEELAHWMDMKEFQQEQICRWHVLVQS